MMNARPAAFLDRDGVINLDRGYVARIEDFVFAPGALAACKTLADCGRALVVVTNQSGIGRGFYTEDDYRELDRWMREQFARAGAPLAGTYFCPHHPDAAIGAYRRTCDCRKPAPGMLMRAATELNLNLGRSILFGDKPSDLAAAAAAGVAQRILLGADGADNTDSAAALATGRYCSLAQAVAALCPHHRSHG